MDKVMEKWNEILQMVKEEHGLTDVSFNTWIKPLEVFAIDGNTLYILVPSEQMGLSYINKKYYLPLKVAIGEVTGIEYDIQFILPDQAQSLKFKNNDTPQLEPQTPVKGDHSNLNPNYTFDTFVVGNNNRFAHSASLAVAESPGEAYNPLYIYGGPGLGKTHLMHSIGHFIIDQNPDTKVLYVTSEEFTNEVIESIRNGNSSAMTKFRDKYRTVDVLMIDDIQFIIGKESTQEEFFHTFNTLHNDGRQIVIASDRPAKEIKSLEERLRTRFEWGLTADIQPPDFETRVAIVKRKAELLNLDLPNDVAEYIANHLKQNIRQLEGAVKKLNAYYLLEGIEPCIGVTTTAIKDTLNDSQPIPVTIEKILNEVARTYNVMPSDIRGKKRNANVSAARQMTMYIIREVTGMSMEAIGQEFQRDHSTVVYSIKTMEENIKRDQHLKEMCSDIMKNVRT